MRAGIAGLPDSQRSALEGVRSGAGTGNLLAVCAGTLALLTDAAQGEPVLLLVDDAQWIDPSSADAIAFALRRIESDPIVALVAVRAAGVGATSTPARFSVLDLDGLDGDAAGELLGRTARSTPAVADACVAAVGGNPLALTELDRTLDDAQRDGRRPLDDPPPVGAALARLVGRRIASLPADSRAALVLVAIGAPFPAPLPDPARPARPRIARARRARASRRSSRRGSVVGFAHPLLRAAALDGIEPAQRRRTHAVLAERSRRPATRIAPRGTSAPRPTVPTKHAAAALEAAGERAVARGAAAGAVDAFERAAPSDVDDARPRPPTLPRRSRRVARRHARGRREVVPRSRVGRGPRTPSRLRVHARDGDRVEHRHAVGDRAAA